MFQITAVNQLNEVRDEGLEVLTAWICQHALITTVTEDGCNVVVVLLRLCESSEMHNAATSATTIVWEFVTIWLRRNGLWMDADKTQLVWLQTATCCCSSDNSFSAVRGHLNKLYWIHGCISFLSKCYVMSPTGEHTCFAGTSTVNRSLHRHSSCRWLEAPAWSSTKKLAATSGRRHWPICWCCPDRGPGSFDVEDALRPSAGQAQQWVREWVESVVFFEKSAKFLRITFLARRIQLHAHE